MSDLGYIVLAFGLVWGAVALYLLRLSVLRRELARRVEKLEKAGGAR
jgi:CcmD family protein